MADSGTTDLSHSDGRKCQEALVQGLSALALWEVAKQRSLTDMQDMHYAEFAEDEV